MPNDLLENDSATFRSSSRGRSDSLGGKYLTFRLGKEQFGLEILKVREIMGWINITPVPKAPPSVRGVLNLRGKIVPVIDLRRKFEMVAVENTDRTCIIVVDVHVHGQSADVGILVDNVSEVLNIKSEDIGPPPTLGCDMDTNFILGMAKSAGSVTILLEIENVLSESELDNVNIVDVDTK
jgi:purine-binding chemotaxis protein CheW